jgi:hypothetical protein
VVLKIITTSAHFLVDTLGNVLLILSTLEGIEMQPEYAISSLPYWAAEIARSLGIGESRQITGTITIFRTCAVNIALYCNALGWEATPAMLR